MASAATRASPKAMLHKPLRGILDGSRSDVTMRQSLPPPDAATRQSVGSDLIYLTGYAGDGFGRHVGVEVYRGDSVGDEVAALVDAPLHANLTGFVV